MQAADTFLEAATYYTPAVPCQSMYNISVIYYYSSNVIIILYLYEFCIMPFIILTIVFTISHFQCCKAESAKELLMQSIKRLMSAIV